MGSKRALNDEDQARVDQYLTSGHNGVERGPPRLLRLLLVIIAVVVVLSLASQLPGYLGSIHQWPAYSQKR